MNVEQAPYFVGLSKEAADHCAAPFSKHKWRRELYQPMTAREHEIVGRLTRRFPGCTIRADIREVERAKGSVEALHISVGPDLSVDLERTFIAWPPESTRRLVEAIEARLEMDGVTPSIHQVEGETGALRSRALTILRTPFSRLSSFLP